MNGRGQIDTFTQVSVGSSVTEHRRDLSMVAFFFNELGPFKDPTINSYNLKNIVKQFEGNSISILAYK